jgi:hypothetical protein
MNGKPPGDNASGNGALTDETRKFAKYQNDPNGFIETALYGFVWSRQREVCTSVLENRRTAVKSCHDG